MQVHSIPESQIGEDSLCTSCYVGTTISFLRRKGSLSWLETFFGLLGNADIEYRVHKSMPLGLVWCIHTWENAVPVPSEEHA
jgi:hypothetical protein